MSKRILPVAVLTIAAAAAASASIAQVTLSPDAKCFVVSVTMANAQADEEDRDPDDSYAMFFFGRMDGRQESLAGVDVDSALREMSEEEFVAETKRCLNELTAALDRQDLAKAGQPR